MNTVKPIGEIIYPNKEGYFDSAIDQTSALQKDWQQPVNLCIQEIQKHLPNLVASIYIRGSIARGSAIAGISDIDLVVITKNKLPDIYNKNWVRPFVKKLRESYPFVDDVEFETIPMTTLINTKQHLGIRVLLSLQGKLLVGEEVLSRLPVIKPDASSFVHIPTFSRFQTNIQNTLTTKDVFLPAYIPWLAKRYIRTGFELCIQREKVFTRDLYPCYEVFSKYYPSKEYGMYKILEQALSPSWSKRELYNCVNTIGEWLSLEIKKQYPNYRL